MSDVSGAFVTLQPQALQLPLRWKKPRAIFVSSMSVLFHERVPDAFVRRGFDVMRRASWHRFQVLTKRSERMAKLAASLDWPPNVWIDVSVESAAFSNRIDDLNSDAGRRERQHEG